MATRITIDRKLTIKASANPQNFSCRREILGSGAHPRNPVFNSSHHGVGLPKKSLQVFVNSCQFSSTLCSTQVRSRRIYSTLIDVFNQSSAFSFAVSSGPVLHLRQILYTLPKFVEIPECSNCDVARFFLEYQWFQSGLNCK